MINTLGVPGFGCTVSGYHSTDSAYVLPILPLNSWPYLAKESSLDGAAVCAPAGNANATPSARLQVAIAILVFIFMVVIFIFLVFRFRTAAFAIGYRRAKGSDKGNEAFRGFSLLSLFAPVKSL